MVMRNVGLKIHFFLESLLKASYIYIFIGETNRDGSKKLPYSKISSLGITVTGLPDGVSLKHPSSYGRKQLQSILDCKERLIINCKVLKLNMLYE